MGFLRARPELLHKMPKAGQNAASKGWPSPRSWEMAMRAHAGAAVHKLDQTDADTMMGAFVGETAACEFSVWKLKADLPDPIALLDDKVEFRHDARRLDRTAAVLGACSAIVTPEDAPKRKERAAVLWSIIGDLIDQAPDVTELAARALVRARLAVNIPTGAKALARLQPILVAANVQAR
jgi:hypothetical protein